MIHGMDTKQTKTPGPLTKTQVLYMVKSKENTHHMTHVIGQRNIVSAYEG